MRDGKRRSQKEEMEHLVHLLESWQSLEKRGIEFLTQLQSETENPVLREILEIVKHDSVNHHRVQQFMIDGLTKKALSLTPEEVGAIWQKLEEHDKLEQKTIEMARDARHTTGHPVMRYYLSYLLADEEKHHHLLENLEDIKRDLYPYGW